MKQSGRVTEYFPFELVEIYECICIPCKLDAVGKEGHRVCQTFLDGGRNLCGLGRGLWKASEIQRRGHTEDDVPGQQNHTDP